MDLKRKRVDSLGDRLTKIGETYPHISISTQVHNFAQCHAHSGLQRTIKHVLLVPRQAKQCGVHEASQGNPLDIVG